MSRVGKAATGSKLAFEIAIHPSNWRDVPNWAMTLVKPASPLARAQPWMAFNVCRALETIVDESSRVFEFGGGGSTVWFASRVREVITVEHSREWFERLQEELNARQFHNTTLHHVPPDAFEHESDKSDCSDRYISVVEGGCFRDYVHSIDAVPDESIDLTVIDGRCRMSCVVQAAPKVRPGGSILIDDSSRPRYSAAPGILSGWQKNEISGLRSGSRGIQTSTIWTKRVDLP